MKFSTIEEPMRGKYAPSAGEQQIAPETSDLLGYSSKAVAPPQGTGLRDRNSGTACERQQLHEDWPNAFTSLTHGVTAITSTVSL